MGSIGDPAIGAISELDMETMNGQAIKSVNGPTIKTVDGSAIKSVNGPAMTPEQIKLYADRIGLADLRLPAWATQAAGALLRQLQQAHIRSIPFENLDIMEGRELSLKREDLFDKIILRKRGGVCSELNTLYNWLLESLGFDVTSFISRIIARTAPLQANSHRVMAVRIGSETYITDVGFNFDHHRIPLLLKEGILQSDGECEYRFERDEFAGWIMHQKTAKGWRGKISFTESPQCDLDFVGPTYFAQYHPDSKINKALKVSIHKEDGFYAIREGCFLKEEQGIVRELEKLAEDERIKELLTGFFGIGDVREQR